MYPFYKELQILSDNFNSGNFGLWYNKFIPINDSSFKASGKNGDDKEPVKFYQNQYEKICLKNNIIKKILTQKHLNQSDFFAVFPDDKYDKIIITAKLISPLITGVGESHPHEVSMVFDHNLGIPYIPASGIKGIVRFAHTLSIIPEAIENNKIENNKFDDEEDWTKIPLMFGKGGDKGNRGRTIFLDAYPVNIPNLHEDIMNPHYGAYYLEGKPPADFLTPVPIKFLTVEKGTEFVFRAVVSKEYGITDMVKKAFKKALTEEGVGAKTAVGYGRFEIKKFEEHSIILEEIKKREEKKKKDIEEKQTQEDAKKFESMSEVDKLCYKLSQNPDEPKSMELFGKIDNFESDDKLKIAKALQECWQKINKWDKKSASKKQEAKIKKIEDILK